jgi:hypothetical protein
MRAEPSAVDSPPTGWLSRAILSGFIATGAMSILFFAAYGFARVVSVVELADRRGASSFREWMGALTSNPVIDLAAGSLYLAGGLHLILGIAWAALYAYYFEPRLMGPNWFRGMTFALIPWLLSLVVFFPLIGGGFLGMSIGAGPLPAIGNLILHLAYGMTLGAMYGPLGDIAADEFPSPVERDAPEVVARYEGSAARGLAVGAMGGGVLGLIALTISLAQPGALPGAVPGIALLAIGVMVGATFGGVFGSIVGLSAGRTR